MYPELRADQVARVAETVTEFIRRETSRNRHLSDLLHSLSTPGKTQP
jgi:hypothetical protein